MVDFTENIQGQTEYSRGFFENMGPVLVGEQASLCD